MIQSDPSWYRDAIIYEAHVKAIYDANDDGIGDFQGLTQKLDYFQDLGITALWILPFYPSPLRDDGYDIADYRSVNPAYGTLRDFKQFVREAHSRGIRVVTELVINHTSDQHPWFQRARTAKPGSSWRNFYVWSDTDQKYLETRVIFLDTETSNWAWDPVAQAYYWHRFYSHQPDLNFDNPRVLKEVERVMEYWLDMGVDGLRLDAIPYLCERDGTNNENLDATHLVIKKIRAALDKRYPDRMLLAEANQWPEDVRPYFGDGDECHMAFHFPLMPRIYMALAQEDRHPITDIMRQTPEIPERCQWAIFLRNHDELTLEMVTDRERDYLWTYYASDARARINLGIRRRLAPLLDNDRRKIELLNSLLMSMPGTPILYYGDEIGMGDNIFLGDRDGVRTPMQWSPDRNAGFSRADSARLFLPPVTDPVYGYEAVNVEAQNRSRSSLLNWMKRLIAARKSNVAFGRGTLTFLYPGNRKVLAYLREYEGSSLLCVANLSRAAQPVELDLSRFAGRIPVELLGNSNFPPVGDLPYFLTLPSYGFYWFLLAAEAEAPSWHKRPPTISEPVTLVLAQGWQTLLRAPVRQQLEERVIPDYLAPRRWLAAKGDRITAARIVPLAEMAPDRPLMLMAIASLSLEVGEERPAQYAFPLSIIWEGKGDDHLTQLAACTLARVRQGPKLGVLVDAMGDDRFVRELVAAMVERRRLPAENGGTLAFEATSAMPPPTDLSQAEINRTPREQSNSSLRLGNDMMLKLYRRLQPGIHPELEMARYLTDVAHYPHTPALLGSLVLEMPDAEPIALASLAAYVLNQGDGWALTLDYLGRFLEEADLLPTEALGDVAERHDAYLGRVRRLGQRVAELHQALARPAEDAAFAPEPVKPRDIADWRAQVLKQARSTFAALRRVEPGLPPEPREQARQLLRRRQVVLDRIKQELPGPVDAVKTRYHGDLHLGQVLVVQDDFMIIDFEGEPARPVAQRRAKHSPLRDVAGMLRSFDYAAAAAQTEEAAVRPESRALVAAMAEDWRRRAKQAFLEGYTTAIAGCPSYPTDSLVAHALLDFFALEKALYEVEYEAANRPGWVPIPVRGVLDLLGEPALMEEPA